MPNPQDGGPPFVVCTRLLIQYIRSYPPYLEATSPWNTNVKNKTDIKPIALLKNTSFYCWLSLILANNTEKRSFWDLLTVSAITFLFQTAEVEFCIETQKECFYFVDQFHSYALQGPARCIQILQINQHAR
jgi:hypothetical protein